MSNDSSAKHCQDKKRLQSSRKTSKSFKRKKRKKQQYGSKPYKNLLEDDAS